jgi:hypothetical protein
MEISATVHPTGNIAVIEDDTSMRSGAGNEQKRQNLFPSAASGCVVDSLPRMEILVFHARRHGPTCYD